MCKAAIAAEQEAADGVQEVETTSLETARLRSELERTQAELEVAKAEAAKSKSRAAKLEAENKSLKQQIKSRKVEVTYSGRPPSYYADQPDLRDLSEGIGSLTQQSTRSKKDLDELVKSLEKLR